jgi:hypothetical protein
VPQAAGFARPAQLALIYEWQSGLSQRAAMETILLEISPRAAINGYLCPDGKHVHLGGSASDILRRGADGLWRYIIDNNQGTAVRQPA